ncbi:MAG: hypothetical protein AAGA80_02235 [Cyanobacteria bacterium P01_F01_bin.143]
MGRNSLYVIGIGGTGAKCLEAITHIASVGLLTDSEVKFLFVDADETNGNLERTRSSLNIYNRTHHLIAAQGDNISWVKTPINSYTPDIWSPFSNTSTNKNLGSFFGYNHLQQGDSGLGDLFDFLYTQEEREVNLDVGFRGNPAIGAAVMGNLDLDYLEEDPWAGLIYDIFSDVGRGQTPRIFLCGSIFGGTGTAGLTTLGRLIYNKLQDEKILGVKIACLFLLPYFGFSQPIEKDANNRGVYAGSEQFLLNTELALRHYSSQNKYFDTVYILGNHNLSNYDFSIGKSTQKNEPHFLELYASLAARHFLTETAQGKNAVVLNSRKSTMGITWDDLPNTTETKSKLVNATRFAYVWLSNIAPELDYGNREELAKLSRYTLNFYRPQAGGLSSLFNKKGEDYPNFYDAVEQQKISDITEWCQDYLRWLLGIHKCDGDNIQLFQDEILSNLNDQGANLGELILDDNRDRNTKQQDTVQRLHRQLAEFSSSEKGTVGLAKALYKVCNLL